jgi:hypothetical protein
VFGGCLRVGCIVTMRKFLPIRLWGYARAHHREMVLASPSEEIV